MKPFDAALEGAREIGFTVFSISMSLIAVFIPILLMGGIVGRLFREFAVTLSVAIFVSMLISLTTTPMMCAWLLKGKEEQKHGRAVRRERARLPVDSRPLRDDAPLGAAPPAAHARRDARDDGGDDLSLRQGAEGLLPAAGHRPPFGLHPGRPEHVLCGDAKARRRFRGRRHEGPGRPLRAGVRGWTGCPEPGPDVRHAEASPRAQGHRGPDHRAPEGAARVRGRRQPVPAGGAGPAHRRLRVERPVPVHAFRRQPEGPRGLGAEGPSEAPVRQGPRGPQHATSR